MGDYAHAGATNISVIDADSYWIDGYFEETKMAHICIGDRAEAELMGYRDPIIGRVESVTRGISVSNASPSTQGLPNVDPVYTWVRLAQRVPVRIRITHVPTGVPLVSGMTATVTIRDAGAQESGGWLRQRLASLEDLWRHRAPLAVQTACRGSAMRMAQSPSFPRPNRRRHSIPQKSTRASRPIWTPHPAGSEPDVPGVKSRFDWHLFVSSSRGEEPQWSSATDARSIS